MEGLLAVSLFMAVGPDRVLFLEVNEVGGSQRWLFPPGLWWYLFPKKNTGLHVVFVKTVLWIFYL